MPQRLWQPAHNVEHGEDEDAEPNVLQPPARKTCGAWRRRTRGPLVTLTHDVAPVLELLLAHDVQHREDEGGEHVVLLLQLTHDVKHGDEDAMLAVLQLQLAQEDSARR